MVATDVGSRWDRPGFKFQLSCATPDRLNPSILPSLGRRPRLHPGPGVGLGDIRMPPHL